MATGNNTRFVRYWWEVAGPKDDWPIYLKGGRISKYYGSLDLRLDYRPSAHVWYSTSPSARYRRGYEHYFTEGITYTLQSELGFAGRYIPPDCVFDIQGSCIFPQDPAYLYQLLAYLNSRLASQLLHALNPTLDFQVGDLRRLPISPDLTATLGRWSAQLVCIRQTRLSNNVLNYLYDGEFPTANSLRSEINSQILGSLRFEAIECLLAALIEKGLSSNYDADLSTVLNLPMVLSYNRWECIFSVHSRVQIDPSVLDHLRGIPESILPDSLQIWGAIRDSFERSKEEAIEEDQPEPVPNTDTTEESIDLALFSAESATLVDTTVERIALASGIHPASVVSMVEEGITQHNWRVSQLDESLTQAMLTAMILRLLGHRWPKQIEAGEPVPDWADPDGIIPLTEGVGEPTLYDRVRDRIAADFPGGNVTAIEAEFAEIMGKPLEQWLAADFFKHHTSQFKKRPIAWQIGSGKFTARRRPAFACLVYYHKLDGNTLATIQSQYVRPLRGRYETELRGIEAIPAAARSERQAARRIELEGWIAELREFDDRLGRVATEGFASDALAKLIEQEPVDSWCSVDGIKPRPADREALQRQEMAYIPDLNDGVRVNIAPLQKAGLLAADVIAGKDIEKAIADRAEWRADERRWCREGKLPRPGWWRGT